MVASTLHVGAARQRGLGRETRGFTLIEVLIAMAIVGILTAIALPAYRNYELRGELVAGTNQLSTERTLMEQFYQDNRTYVGGPCSTAQSVGSSGAKFNVSCVATPTASAYTITAAGTGAVAGFTFTIDQDGNQKTTSLPADWGGIPASPYTCWIMAKGAQC